MQIHKRHPLIMGTFILTITGLISRVIGFFYRIYLARQFGEEGMGIYQLLSPVLALSFSLTAAAYQTAISKIVAAHAAKNNKASYLPLLAGISISLPLSLLCSMGVFVLSDYIGIQLLQEERTVSMLRNLSFSIPFSAVHSCINGYFYGLKKTAVPAIAQLIEQLARVGCVYGITLYAQGHGASPTINIAVLGLTVGEFISMLVTILSVYYCYARDHHTGFALSRYVSILPIYRDILAL
ncbi:MAG: oligosaccharide flippase family protein, partial [Lachnospiraceae bacterium]|nr:oligosaccharide flippase family protein [Lachnospiraceae bacterium]